jgi:hypothetical protein
MRVSRRPGAKAVERGLEDWLDVAGVAMDRGDGDDHVEDLLEDLLEELGGDVVLGGRDGEEPVQPDHQHCSGCLAVTVGGLADGIDFVGEQSIEELTAAGEVAVKRRLVVVGLELAECWSRWVWFQTRVRSRSSCRQVCAQSQGADGSTGW